MRQVWIPRAGPPEVLQVQEAPDPTPGPGELRIRVEAAGVNFADIMARMGIYPDLPGIPIVVGYEVAGTVDAAGPGADERWVGKPVFAMTRFGGYSDVVCVSEAQLFERPAGWDHLQAAAFPVTYVTAYQLVVAQGGLRAGETVLIHSAGGGVGLSAIQLARHIGANIIGTASAGKHAMLRELGVTPIDYRTEDFEVRVREITEGKGVELILDAVGGDSFKKGYRVLAPTGRIGMFGMSSAASGTTRSLLSMVKLGLTMPWFTFNPLKLINENKGCFGVNLGRMWDQVDRIRGWIDEMTGMIESGAIAPVVDRSFSFAEAAAAHQYIQDRKNVGKVLLVP